MLSLGINVIVGDFQEGPNLSHEYDPRKKRFTLMKVKAERGYFFNKEATYELDDVEKLEEVTNYSETGILMNMKGKTAFKLKFTDGKKFLGVCDTELFLKMNAKNALADF